MEDVWEAYTGVSQGMGKMLMSRTLAARVSLGQSRRNSNRCKEPRIRFRKDCCNWKINQEIARRLKSTRWESGSAQADQEGSARGFKGAIRKGMSHPYTREVYRLGHHAICCKRRVSGPVLGVVNGRR